MVLKVKDTYLDIKVWVCSIKDYLCKCIISFYEIILSDNNAAFDEIILEEIELPRIVVTNCDETSTSTIHEESAGVEIINKHQPKINITKRAWQEENENVNISTSLTACIPQNFWNIHEELKKYVKLNILNIIISCLYIPENIVRFYSIYFSLKCKEFGPLDDKICIFQFVFICLYPYFVNKKLEKFK